MDGGRTGWAGQVPCVFVGREEGRSRAVHSPSKKVRHLRRGSAMKSGFAIGATAALIRRPLVGAGRLLRPARRREERASSGLGAAAPSAARRPKERPGAALVEFDFLLIFLQMRKEKRKTSQGVGRGLPVSAAKTLLGARRQTGSQNDMTQFSWRRATDV
jgi:hypothetical protein